jgi:3-oxoadipate enol-lactonase
MRVVLEGLILCDTQCIADTPEGKAKRYKLIDEIALNGTGNFTEGFLKNVFHKDSLTEKKEMVEDIRKVILSNSKHIITMGLKSIG